MKGVKKPINIWNDIEKCWVMRLDIVFESKSIVGIHNSDFLDVVKDIDSLCRKLQHYKSEMEIIYGKKELSKNSNYYTYLYLAKDHSTGYYKIGRSIDPNYREKTLQSQKPTIDIIWRSKMVYKKEEKNLHRYFKNKRIRGEWFNLNNEDIDFIKNYNYGT